MSSASFKDASIPGGIVHNPASAHAREMAKWEMGYSPYGQPGRPREVVGHQEYPAMFYKVSRSLTNGDILTDHMKTAADENEARSLESRGYVQGLERAHRALEASEQSVARAAAERAYRDRNMGERAKAEIEAAEDATSGHMAEVPVTPIRRRGPNKPKA